jgi:hypothetical protein
MNPLQKIAGQVQGLLMKEQDKTDALIEAVDAMNPERVEAAFVRGARPLVSSFVAGLPRSIEDDTCPALSEQIIKILNLFEKHGAKFQDSVVELDGTDVRYPTLISTAIETKMDGEVMDYLLLKGIEPTAPDIGAACGAENNMYLEKLLNKGINAFEAMPLTRQTPIGMVLEAMDLPKLQMIVQHSENVTSVDPLAVSAIQKALNPGELPELYDLEAEAQHNARCAFAGQAFSPLQSVPALQRMLSNQGRSNDS